MDGLIETIFLSSTSTRATLLARVIHRPYWIGTTWTPTALKRFEKAPETTYAPGKDFFTSEKQFNGKRDVLKGVITVGKPTHIFTGTAIIMQLRLWSVEFCFFSYP